MKQKQQMTVATWCKVICLLILLIALIVGVLYTCLNMLNNDKRKGTFANPTFTSVQKVDATELRHYDNDVRETPADIYDNTYAPIHDSLFDQPKQNIIAYECDNMNTIGRLEEYGRKAILLDIGCGLGSHLKQFSKSNLKKNKFD